MLLLPVKNLKTEAVRALLRGSILNNLAPKNVLYVWNGDSIQEKNYQPWRRKGSFGRTAKKYLNGVCKIMQDMVGKADTVGFSALAMAMVSDGGLRSQRLAVERNKVFGLSAKEILVHHRQPSSNKAGSGRNKNQQRHEIQHVYIAAGLTKQERSAFMRSVFEAMGATEGSVTAPLPIRLPAFPTISVEAKTAVMDWRKAPRDIAPASWRSEEMVPLFWRERKPTEWWSALLQALKPDAVVDFTPGCGLPLACLHCSTPYAGLAWNREHKTTLEGIFLQAAKRHLAGRPLLWDDVGMAQGDRDDEEEDGQDDDEDSQSGSD